MASQKGRPTYSLVRSNLIELLYYKKKATGYDLAKLYNELFSQVTMRVIYYNLKKGLLLQEFVVLAVVDEQGEYSWGSHAQKIYYGLGPAAKPKGNARIREFLEKQKTHTS